MSEATFNLLLGTLIATGSALFVRLLDLLQLSIQAKREAEKARFESIEREKDRTAQHNEKTRTEMRDIYANFIASISDYISKSKDVHTIERLKQMEEAMNGIQKWGSWLLIYHYDHDDKNFKQFYSTFADISASDPNKPPIIDCEELRILALEFSLKDPRLR